MGGTPGAGCMGLELRASSDALHPAPVRRTTPGFWALTDVGGQVGEGLQNENIIMISPMGISGRSNRRSGNEQLASENHLDVNKLPLMPIGGLSEQLPNLPHLYANPGLWYGVGTR